MEFSYPVLPCNFVSIPKWGGGKHWESREVEKNQWWLDLPPVTIAPPTREEVFPLSEFCSLKTFTGASATTTRGCWGLRCDRMEKRKTIWRCPHSAWALGALFPALWARTRGSCFDLLVFSLFLLPSFRMWCIQAQGYKKVNGKLTADSLVLHILVFFLFLPASI